VNDEFLTLSGSSEGYYMDRGSKFLAYAFPIENEQEASDVLQKIKKDHPKARHFCIALRLFPDASLERSADGGEPSGSAGKPILGQLVKNNITNVIIIVVRYFGGTKLGIPGLIEAYKTSSANAIQSGAIVSRKVYTMVRITMSYETISPFLNFCKQLKIPVREETYEEKASLIICFSKSTIEGELMKMLGQYTQMDFQNLKDYETHLAITIELLPDALIM
jgi:uncharacterized YigZ family protein